MLSNRKNEGSDPRKNVLIQRRSVLTQRRKVPRKKKCSDSKRSHPKKRGSDPRKNVLILRSSPKKKASDSKREGSDKRKVLTQDPSKNVLKESSDQGRMFCP